MDGRVARLMEIHDIGYSPSGILLSTFICTDVSQHSSHTRMGSLSGDIWENEAGIAEIVEEDGG